MSYNITLRVEGYEKIREKSLKSFDLVFFQGKGYTSDIIRFGAWLSSKNRTVSDTLHFSHVGVIISSDLLKGVENVEPNTLYLWESTSKGRKSMGVKNINGTHKGGVQLYKLDDVIDNYNDYYIKKARKHGDELPKSCMSIGLLDDKTRCEFDIMQPYWADGTFVNTIYNKYQDNMYNSHPFDLVTSVIPFLRSDKINDYLDEQFGTGTWLFCSQLVATVFMDIGLFPNTCKPGYALPTDFLGNDSDKIEDGGIPTIIGTIIDLPLVLNRM